MDLKKITAEGIMSEAVVTVPENIFIKDAVHLMLRERINGVPIVNSDKKIVGILTLTDFFHLIGRVLDSGDCDFLEEVLACKKLKTSEIMSKQVFTIAPSMALDEIISIMMEKKIHTFPVVENDKLVGIIGRHDILNAIFAYS